MSPEDRQLLFSQLGELSSSSSSFSVSAPKTSAGGTLEKEKLKAFNLQKFLNAVRALNPSDKLYSKIYFAADELNDLLDDEYSIDEPDVEDVAAGLRYLIDDL